jgi:hypothetical protein
MAPYSKNHDGLCKETSREEGLSLVLSFHLLSALGIIFFQSLYKFSGAFEWPFLRVEVRTWPMQHYCRVGISDHRQNFGNCFGLAIPA